MWGQETFGNSKGCLTSSGQKLTQSPMKSTYEVSLKALLWVTAASILDTQCVHIALYMTSCHSPGSPVQNRLLRINTLNRGVFTIHMNVYALVLRKKKLVMFSSRQHLSVKSVSLGRYRVRHARYPSHWYANLLFSLVNGKIICMKR